MRIIYTRHSKNRMRWRGITKTEVELTVNEPENVKQIAPDRVHYFRRIRERNIRVTCAIESEKVIIISVVDKYD